MVDGTEGPFLRNKKLYTWVCEVYNSNLIIERLALGIKERRIRRIRCTTGCLYFFEMESL